MKTSTSLMLGLAAWLLANPGSVVAAEAEELSPRVRSGAPLSSDFLIVSGGFNRVSSGPAGGVTSLDWVHLSGNGKTYTTGAEAHSVGDNRWAFARLSSPLFEIDRFESRIGASIGGGKTAGERFPYQIYHASASYQATHQFYLTLSEQYLRLGEARGHLIKPGVTIFLNPRLTTELSFARSIGGNIQTQLVSGRLDLAGRPAGFFGGVVIGHTSPEIVRIGFGNETPGQRMREAYFGIRFRFREIEWTVVADFPDLGTNRQQIYTVGMKLPLRRNRRVHHEK